MKNLKYTLVVFFGWISFAHSTPLFEAGAPQLRIKTKIFIPKGATGLKFSGGNISTDFASTAVCAQKDSMCILDTLELARGRDRYFDANTILNINTLPSMCEGSTGFIAPVSTSRNELRLRCKMSAIPTVEELQTILSQYMTVQYPAKID